MSPYCGTSVPSVSSRHVDVVEDLQARRVVERAGADADRVAVRGVPEQAGPALRAEPTACVRVALRALDPAQRRVAEEHEVPAPRSRGCPGLAAPPAALRAVADEHAAQ